jgi:hypothetical protein
VQSAIDGIIADRQAGADMETKLNRRETADNEYLSSSSLAAAAAAEEEEEEEEEEKKEEVEVQMWRS